MSKKKRTKDYNIFILYYIMTKQQTDKKILGQRHTRVPTAIDMFT